MVELLFWQKIVLYILLLISIFIFVKVSSIKIKNQPILKLKYRIALALFFPVILIAALFLGSIILAIALTVIFIGILFSFFTKGRIRRKPKLIIKRL